MRTEALPLLARVSGDRLLAEFEHIFEEPEAIATLFRLEALGLMKAIHPHLDFDPQAAQRLSLMPETIPASTFYIKSASAKDQRRVMAFTAWLLPLEEKIAETILSRLNYPNGEARIILAALKLNRSASAIMSLSLVELVETLDEYDPFVIFLTTLFTSDEVCRSQMEKYLTGLRTVRPITTGDDLKRRGIPPSPLYRKILGALRNAWLEGRVTNASQELDLLDELLREVQGDCE